MKVRAGDHVYFFVIERFFMNDVLKNLKVAAKVEMRIFFGFKNNMNFIIITVFYHLSKLKFKYGPLSNDLIFNVHPWNIELIDLLEDFFNIRLVNDEKFGLDTGQIKDYVRI